MRIIYISSVKSVGIDLQLAADFVFSPTLVHLIHKIGLTRMLNALSSREK